METTFTQKAMKDLTENKDSNKDKVYTRRKQLTGENDGAKCSNPIRNKYEHNLFWMSWQALENFRKRPSMKIHNPGECLDWGKIFKTTKLEEIYLVCFVLNALIDKSKSLFLLFFF